MSIPAPELEELRAISQKWGLGIGDSDLRVFEALVGGALGSYEYVDAMYDASKPSAPDRPGFRPDDADNELGAWYYRCDIQESDSGPLAGKTSASEPSRSSSSARRTRKRPTSPTSYPARRWQASVSPSPTLAPTRARPRHEPHSTAPALSLSG